MRRGLLWLVVLPPLVVASEVAHGAAYWWAYPQVSLRVAVLSRSGHGYLGYAPVALGFLAAVQVIAFAVVVLDRLRGRPLRSVPAWAFLLIPQLGFVLQEHLERLLATGVFPWWTVLEPSFWRGLLLQFPLGLVAYLVARLLLRTAETVAEAVAARRAASPVGRGHATVRPSPASVLLARRAPLAGLAADRAPPVAAA